MPHHPTPFARALLAHARRWRALHEHGNPDVVVSPMWDHWVDGIWPDLRDAAQQMLLDDGVRPHSHLAALHSSMAFGFNLFLPFRERADLAPLLAAHLGPLRVDRVSFEWVPPGHVLGEIDGEVPRDDEPATGIDVVVHAIRPGGQRVVVLIEVKLAEAGFTPCGGRTSRANRRKDVCADASTFLHNPHACYLQRPYGKQRDRRYWAIFERSYGSVAAAFPGTSPGPCPFAADSQQPMRQLALALGLVQEGLADEAWLLLVHHDDNPDVPSHWQAWRDLAHPDLPLRRLPASSVLRAGRDQGLIPWADWMAGRYRLDAP